MDERGEKLKLLRAHLAEGSEQAENGQFDEGYSLSALLNELDPGASALSAT